MAVFLHNLPELRLNSAIFQTLVCNEQTKAQKYRSLLSDTPVVILPIQANSHQVYHNFPVLIDRKLTSKRDEIVKAVSEEGVMVDVCYPSPLYETPLFVKSGITGDCPNAKDITSRIITLFTDSVLDEQMIIDTTTALKKVLSYYK